MQFTAEILDALNVPYHVEVVSAHRTPISCSALLKAPKATVIRVIIAGAGGAAHLPGMIAAKPRVLVPAPVQSSL